MTDYSQVPSPCYVIDEQALRRNLALIRGVADAAGVEIIVALKAFAGWSAFAVMNEYVRCATASSAAEARLAFEQMGTPVHAYAPVYTDTDFPEILRCSSHITFNSPAQLERFLPRIRACDHPVSCGLRINPGYSPVGTGLYNPCAPGSRLGITAAELDRWTGGNALPDVVEGLHFHTLCESGAEELERTLQIVERDFGRYLPSLRWLNMGGGHLMTREGYDTRRLIGILRAFRERHPQLHLILEPGSAFTWETGVLVSTVEDIVESDGIRTAMLDVSFACHMPDCLEMPYKPHIEGAADPRPGKPVYRMGGNSCLAGDFAGEWSFDRELRPGDRIVFADMIHYTMVKTTMFNGVRHPSIAWRTAGGDVRLIRRFGYEDYKSRMS